MNYFYIMMFTLISDVNLQVHGLSEELEQQHQEFEQLTNADAGLAAMANRTSRALLNLNNKT